MLSLRKLDYPADEEELTRMWGWMQRQPNLYEKNYGYAKLKEVFHVNIPINYYGLFQGDRMVGAISLVLESKGVCHFGLTCPLRLRYRAILPLIWQFWRAYFEEYDGLLLYATAPSDAPKAWHKLVAILGAQRTAPNRWEYSLFHYFRDIQNGIKRSESL